LSSERFGSITWTSQKEGSKNDKRTKVLLPRRRSRLLRFILIKYCGGFNFTQEWQRKKIFDLQTFEDKRLMDDVENPSAIDPEESSPPNGVQEVRFSPKIVHFADLARCGNEVWIEHQGMLYRLQSTRQGKLILTK
jgi:hemin uptake protein HemP